jgi:hypothetical protein
MDGETQSDALSSEQARVRARLRPAPSRWDVRLKLQGGAWLHGKTGPIQPLATQDINRCSGIIAGPAGYGAGIHRHRAAAAVRAGEPIEPWCRPQRQPGLAAVPNSAAVGTDSRPAFRAGIAGRRARSLPGHAGATITAAAR